MGLFHRLFSSSETLVKEIVADDAHMVKQWESYVGTVGKKNADDLQGMKKLLRIELSDIHDEEKDERELLADLKKIDHAQKVKKIHKLEQCLGYVETKYEYVYRLLEELYKVLQFQMHLVAQLLGKPKNPEKLRAHLYEQLALEKEIIGKFGKMETFHESFLVLLKGEHVIHTMDEHEKKLLARMQKGVQKIFSGEITQGITYEWAMTVFEAIEDKVHEGVAKELFAGYHPDIDFEFVNRSEFVDLAKESIRRLKKKPVSDEMISVFVHLFREWFNQRD